MALFNADGTQRWASTKAEGLGNPHGLAVVDDELFVADNGLNLVHVLSVADGHVVRTINSPDHPMTFPADVAFDPVARASRGRTGQGLGLTPRWDSSYLLGRPAQVFVRLRRGDLAI